MKKPKTPFAKPPTSQHCTPPFYWRGGDTYHEKEYMTDEHRNALHNLHKAEEEYERLRAEVQAASERLRERDSYTAALAGFLDGDPEGFVEERRAKEELRKIEKQIVLCERDLKAKRAKQNPGVVGALQKERAYYQIEIERLTKAFEDTDDEVTNYKTLLAALSISKRYDAAAKLEWQQIKLSHKRRFLKSLVHRTKNQFDSRKPVHTGRTSAANTERTAMMGRIDRRLALLRTQETNSRRHPKYVAHINILVDRIEGLNNRMLDIGLMDDVVDTQSLRERALASIERTQERSKPLRHDAPVLTDDQEAISDLTRDSEESEEIRRREIIQEVNVEIMAPKPQQPPDQERRNEAERPQEEEQQAAELPKEEQKRVEHPGEEEKQQGAEFLREEADFLKDDESDFLT
jgi:hypothetical protein